MKLAYRHDGEKVRFDMDFFQKLSIRASMITVEDIAARVCATTPEHMAQEADTIANFLYENEERVNGFIHDTWDGRTGYDISQDDIEVFFGIIVLATRKNDSFLFWHFLIPKIRDALLYLVDKAPECGCFMRVCPHCGEAFAFQRLEINFWRCPNCWREF